MAMDYLLIQQDAKNQVHRKKAGIIKGFKKQPQIEVDTAEIVLDNRLTKKMKAQFNKSFIGRSSEKEDKWLAFTSLILSASMYKIIGIESKYDQPLTKIGKIGKLYSQLKGTDNIELMISMSEPNSKLKKEEKQVVGHQRLIKYVSNAIKDNTKDKTPKVIILLLTELERILLWQSKELSNEITSSFPEGKIFFIRDITEKLRLIQSKYPDQFDTEPPLNDTNALNLLNRLFKTKRDKELVNEHIIIRPKSIEDVDLSISRKLKRTDAKEKTWTIPEEPFLLSDYVARVEV